MTLESLALDLSTLLAAGDFDSPAVLTLANLINSLTVPVEERIFEIPVERIQSRVISLQ